MNIEEGPHITYTISILPLHDSVYNSGLAPPSGDTEERVFWPIFISTHSANASCCAHVYQTSEQVIGRIGAWVLINKDDSILSGHFDSIGGRSDKPLATVSIHEPDNRCGFPRLVEDLLDLSTPN